MQVGEEGGLLRTGEHVEVRLVDEGLRGSWHHGTILGFSESTWSWSVEYTHHKNLDNTNLVDLIPITPTILGSSNQYRGRIRPPPPPVSHQSLVHGLCVDVLFNDVWWEGVVIENVGEDGSLEETVFFPDEGDEQRDCLSNIRITQDWDEFSGQWRIRGHWPLIGVVENLQKKGLFLPLKRLWYEVRMKSEFMQRILEWNSGQISLWEKLINGTIREAQFALLSNSDCLASDFNRAKWAAREQTEKHNRISVDDEVMGTNAYSSLFSNGSNSRVYNPQLAFKTDIMEEGTLNLSTSINCFSDDGILGGSSTGTRGSDLEMEDLSLPTNSLKNINDINLKSRPSYGRESWVLIDKHKHLKAVYCPQAITDYLLEFKKRRLDNDDKAKTNKEMVTKAMEHLKAVGWHFLYKQKNERFETRYISPIGKSYNSLYTACAALEREGIDKMPYTNGICKNDSSFTKKSMEQLDSDCIVLGREGINKVHRNVEKCKRYSSLINKSVEMRETILGEKGDRVPGHGLEHRECYMVNPAPPTSSLSVCTERASCRGREGQDVMASQATAQKVYNTRGIRKRYTIEHVSCDEIKRHDLFGSPVITRKLRSIRRSFKRNTWHSLFTKIGERDIQDLLSFSTTRKVRSTRGSSKRDISFANKSMEAWDGRVGDEEREEVTGHVLVDREVDVVKFSASPSSLHSSCTERASPGERQGQYQFAFMAATIENKGEENEVSDVSLQCKNGLGLCKTPRNELSVSHTPSIQTVLSWMINNRLISLNEELYYQLDSEDDSLIRKGKVRPEGIMCDCCHKIYTIADFEAHVKTPSTKISLVNGTSLYQCQKKMLGRSMLKGLIQTSCERKKREYGHYKTDKICSVCHHGETLVTCHRCSSAYHLDCLDQKDSTGGKWFCPSCCCAKCGRGEFNDDNNHFTETAALCCEQCERQYHAGCWNEMGLLKLQIYSGGNWFCSINCSKIHAQLRGLLGKPNSIGAQGLRWTLLRGRNNDSNDPNQSDTADMAAYHCKLCVACDVLHECFVPIIDSHTNGDLFVDLLSNERSGLKWLDFWGFYTMILERGDEIISVATIRIHGESVAEMSLVGTCVKFRRQGMCRILLDELEKMLSALGVEVLTLPSILQLTEMWKTCFGFKEVGHLERAKFLGFTFLNFQQTTMCWKSLK
ncbi:uncharacterized protein LOC18423636 isoform X3 [Amborella trichopoda]|uniref:uncharacterized protein LOC18423636 isoform X3 n=1 Tax=Amborella trichopoda TaxID=13333 RepID=UPI0009BE2FDE|nr:uncharacterized protein LOC18423636 isoform X3 [Amborella trichopoda]|eukprot:XP_020530687.1 uncharacterized protein LOC18423636 isoform X3 [Amborella trichopoda]